jgi:alanyl-tRNA synthetase
MQGDKSKQPLSKIERKIKQKKDLEDEIKRLKKQENKAKRRWETNQKVRVGAAIISEANKRPEMKEELLQLLDRFYTKDYDRRFFVEWGLSPQHRNANPPAKQGDGQ